MLLICIIFHENQFRFYDNHVYDDDGDEFIQYKNVTISTASVSITRNILALVSLSSVMSGCSLCNG